MLPPAPLPVGAGLVGAVPLEGGALGAAEEAGGVAMLPPLPVRVICGLFGVPEIDSSLKAICC
jgi:hypothetical protein